MKVYTKRSAGEDLLFLETENEGESELLIDYVRPREPLRATVHYNDGYKNPLIVIRKEVD